MPILLVLLMVVAVTAEILYGLAWLLRSLDVASIFDRYIPAMMNSWMLFGLLAAIALGIVVMKRLYDRII